MTAAPLSIASEIASESGNESVQDLWQSIRRTASDWARREPVLAGWLTHCVLEASTFEYGLGIILSDKVADSVLPVRTVLPMMMQAMSDDPGIIEAAAVDLDAHCARNPACPDHLTALLFFKGYHAVQAHRIAHWFWRNDRQALANYMQGRGSEVFGVDIHPAARFGRGIFFDHATGIVVGETAVIDDDVSILQGVTLGGTGKECGDRHPKIRSGVMISAGSKVLGNIEIGQGAKIGANSVVLKDVAPHSTVVGVPGRVVGGTMDAKPSLTMDQSIDCDSFDPGI